MSLKPPLPSDTLELTIRFSASLPDLHLSISLASQPHANTSTLKQLIRTHLPSEYSSRRIRLIYSGKALGDDAALSTSLKRSLSHPPSRAPTPRPTSHHGPPPGEQPSSTSASSNSLKGKTPIRDNHSIPTTTTRIYIHCSIGDLILTPTELATESRLAQPQDADNTTTTTTTSQPTEQHPPAPPPVPRGFDRLLTAGFTPTEVTALRVQFLAIQAHTHTPDDMPSPTTLRALEDMWLDNTNTASNSLPDNTDGANGAAGDALLGAAGGANGSDEETEGSALDDMLYGMAMGFFWPVGCIYWAQREEGIWSGRRKLAVLVGVVLNVGVAFVRVTG